MPPEISLKMTRLRSLFIPLLWMLFCTLAAAGQSRTALVIGNGEYQQGRLKNPANDARAIAATLQGLGFEVQLHTDADQREMDEAIKQFGKTLTVHQGVGLFYYAGHGIQHDGVNYLMPLNSNVDTDVDLNYRAVNFSRVLDKMNAAGNGINIAILDACRDNPLKRSFSRSGQQGLARADATGDGMLIMYSTSPGQTAEDGGGLHSPFTAALLKYLPNPNYHVSELLNEVGLAVRRDTQKKQIPWMSSSPFPKIYLQARLLPPTSALTAAPVRAFRPESDQVDIDSPGFTVPLPSDPVQVLPLGIQLVSIPGGRFAMGSKDHEVELPVHLVDISPFRLMAHEVTQGQWQAIMGNNPASFTQCGSKCPVENVSWHDVQTFINKLNQKTDLRFRLPSEAEWEYAARAGTTTAFAFGDQLSTEQANFHGEYTYNDSSEGIYREKTVPVDSFQPNGWGLYNMHGNVWEWTQDCWNDSYIGAPEDGSPWLNGNCSARVLRGGSWIYGPEQLRSAHRFWYGASSRSYHYGFRLVLDR